MKPLGPLERLGRDIAAGQDAMLPPVVERARKRFLAPPFVERLRSRTRALSLVLVAAAALTVVVVSLFRSRTPQHLTFEVAAARGVVNQWVLVPPSESIPVHFSDGTSVLLKPSARGQVAEVTASGARVQLARGHAVVSVVPRADAHWSFDVGPFAIAVHGTRFDTGWDPVNEVFVLDLHDGSVSVSGPTIEGARVVVAGQALKIALAPLSEEDAGTPPMEAPPPAPPPVASASSALPETPPPVRSAEPRPDPWRVLSGQGQYAAALAAATPRFDEICTSGPSPDVITLADTARLAADLSRAKRAYAAVRSRFPGTSDAGLAAFALGRMASQAGADAEAAQWFETYLRERPHDRFARETLGRLIEIRDRQGDAVAAKALAGQYLEKYPDGPHAKLARQLVAP
jgi:TolA-binding protein